ncbi:MAG: M48 family metallopeptidase [Gammaproteobacteria bacterium]
MLTETYTQEDIRNGFRADIRAHRLGVGERCAMGAAALAAICLPVCFLALLVAATIGWIHSCWFYFSEPLVSPGWTALMVVGSLLLAGFIAAMVRRLVLVGRQRRGYLDVSAGEQPELHAFVNHIADLLGGPAPSVIKLDAEVGLLLRPQRIHNAVLGGGPELIIGLPLLYGLSARQLSGVIAHAYAGYTREARSYGYPLICAVDRWLFAQSGVARSATSVNGAFAALAPAGGNRLIMSLQKLFDFLVQGTFFLLYRVVSSLTFVVSRRVDMVGDQFSSRIAGSSEFRSTQFRLRSLYYGQQHANRELIKSWRSSRLSDNFPHLVVDHADALQLSLRPRLIQEMEELVTPMTRSRIVDLGRIVSVEHYQDEGACFLLGSAVTLLRDLDSVARRVSLDHYRDMGIERPDLISPTREALVVSTDRERLHRSEVFSGLERSGRVLRIDDFDVFADMSTDERLGEMMHLFERLEHDRAVILHLADTFRNFDSRKNMLHVRKVIEESQSAEAAVIRDIEFQWLALIKEQSEIKAELVQYESVLARRIGLALSLAQDNLSIRQQFRLDEQGMHSHLVRLTDALNFLHRAAEPLQRLRTYTQILGQLMVCSATEEDQRVKPQQDSLLERYQKYVLLELASVLRHVEPVAHPMMAYAMQTAGSLKALGEALQPPTIGEVLRIEIVDLDSASTCPEACHRVANGVLQYLESLNEQLQDRVSLLVARTESEYTTLAQAR